MSKRIPFFLLSFLFLTHPAWASLSTFAVFPPITHCAITDGDRWFGQTGQSCGTSFNQGSNVAYEFSVNKGLKIQSIEGWVSYNGIDPVSSAGSNFVLYKGSLNGEHTGTIPSDKVIFEKAFSFAVDPNFEEPADWRGVSDLSLQLHPGTTYWASFEDGVRGTFVTGAPGIRFSAIHNPEPATLALLGGGLLGAFARRRRATKT